jgi:hypothetical protein
MEYKYYFAYGADMEDEVMFSICPEAEYVRASQMKHAKINYHKCGLMNIVADYDDDISTIGTLWKLNPTDQQMLNFYKTIGNIYKKRIVPDEKYGDIIVYTLTDKYANDEIISTEKLTNDEVKRMMSIVNKLNAVDEQKEEE